MKSWTPEKHQLETMLEEVISKMKSVNTVSEIEGWLNDALNSFACHVFSRAKAERKQANTANDKGK